MIDDMLALWSWPMRAAQLSCDVIETWVGAQQVVAARLPMIAAAAVDPIGANHAELSRMVREKVDAFGRSRHSLDAAGARVRVTARANARALGRMAGGDMLSPAEWQRLYTDNLATTAVLSTLAQRSLKPIHAEVAANTKRLKARR